jgi:ribosomal protein L7/L12
MTELYSLTDGDAEQVSRNCAQIMNLADDIARDGNARAFEIYKLARNTLEILAFDRISRDTIAKLSVGQEHFRGLEVSEKVKRHILNEEKIGAIKQLREESGLGLKESKDWVEAYMAERVSSESWKLF